MGAIRIMGTGNHNMAKVVKIAVELVVDTQVRISLESIADDVDASLLSAVSDIDFITQGDPVTLFL